MQFSRPGKFRWEYDKPYEQTIVGDGTRLWIYDKDLNQVTVRKLDRALGASPAALLAGSNEIEKSYALKAAGNEGGLDWLEAVPKTQDTAFERIRLGFGKAGLEAMELRDQFGQTTRDQVRRPPAQREDRARHASGSRRPRAPTSS